MIVARTSRELTAIVERVIGDHAAGEGFGTKTQLFGLKLVGTVVVLEPQESLP